MAAKPLEIHPAALAELKAALAWYLERSETAALSFVAELDRAIGLVMESPGAGRAVNTHSEIRPEALSVCTHLPGRSA
jgi:plasmid stabilization system protein ParE